MGRTGGAVLGLALLAAGCEDVRHDYMPLAVGNRWEYRQFVREAGAEQELPRARVELARQVDRHTYAEPGGRRYWSKRAGFISLHHNQAPYSIVYLLILPPHTGYGWWWRDASRGERYWCTVAGRETVEVPAGTFRKCVRVRMRPGRRDLPTVLYWFAPEVGIVRFVQQGPDGAEHFVRELAGYELKGEPDPRLGLDDIDRTPAAPAAPAAPLPPLLPTEAEGDGDA